MIKVGTQTVVKEIIVINNVVYKLKKEVINGNVVYQESVVPQLNAPTIELGGE